MTSQELDAVNLAGDAISALSLAIASYEAAGFGGHVTDPLREAMRLAQWSVAEVIGSRHD
jgi:predicted membrane-bound spermidine synthase